jgi:PAS domain S-box-containing protein
VPPTTRRTPTGTPPAEADADAAFRLRDGLRRWRALFVLAFVLIGAVAIAGFTVERRSTAWVLHSGATLRAASAAHLAAWDAESAVRSYLLLADSSAPERGARAAAAMRAQLDTLRALTADDPAQGARLTALDAAIARWDSTFVAVAYGTGVLTRESAVTGTRRFDEVSHLFDEVIGAEADLRLARIERQRTARRVALAVLLLALLASGIAFAWLARELETHAAAARLRGERLAEQADELERQAVQLEAQAAVLEEQAAELAHRLVEREETSRLLEQTATFLDSALESAPIGIAFYDESLRFQRINAELARTNGAPARDHIGRSIEEMIPGLAPTVRPILERVLASGRTETDVVIEGETPGTGGERRRWSATYYPIAARGRDPVGVGCMVMDVTERSALEEQLRQAQKMEAVGRLAGGIAHDFNNILTIIQSYAEILAAELPDAASGRAEVDAIRGAADRATALARQLLAFSRRDVVIPRDVDVGDTVRGMGTIMQRLLRQGIELDLALDPEPLLVTMDQGQLEQVLMNLAINAVDAMPEGGTLRIATRRSATLPQPDGTRDASAAVLEVTDNGTGMDHDVQQRLFEPFFTTKPAGRGTGLGLATTYAIVRDAGGFIRVGSAPNDGSRFEVFLPLSEAARPEPERRPSPAPGTGAARPGETILIAEDEPAIRAALARVLRANGYRVLEAADGTEALRIAGAEPGGIDVLLTDVMMPGMGGMELVRRLRAARPATRVMIMSGYTSDEALRTELGGARSEFLQKPFTARAVSHAVRTLLDAD